MNNIEKKFKSNRNNNNNKKNNIKNNTTTNLNKKIISKIEQFIKSKKYLNLNSVRSNKISNISKLKKKTSIDVDNNFFTKSQAYLTFINLYLMDNKIFIILDNFKKLEFVNNKKQTILFLKDTYTISLVKKNNISIFCFNHSYINYQIKYRYKNDDNRIIGYIKYYKKLDKYKVSDDMGTTIFNLKKIFVIDDDNDRSYYLLQDEINNYKIFIDNYDIKFKLGVFSTIKKYLLIFLFYLLLK